MEEGGLIHPDHARIFHHYITRKHPALVNGVIQLVIAGDGQLVIISVHQIWDVFISTPLLS
jgi:hypothetical protein